MSDHRDRSDAARRAEDSPTAWFVALETARRANDFEGAAAAVRELERLGVRVRYAPRRRKVVRDAR